MNPVFTDLPVNEFYLSRAEPYKRPVQLWIRNTRQGMIWQVYNVKSPLEVDLLTHTAKANGFGAWELCYNPNDFHEQTWPDWRNTEMWQERNGRFEKALS